MKRILIPLLLICAPLSSAFGYNMIERARLFSDQMQTLDMLNPYGHDFYFGVNASITTDATSLISDASDIGDIDTGTTTGDIAEVNRILSPYYDKEQAARVQLDVGIPLPSFTIKGVNIVPDFNLNVGLMTMLTPGSDTLTTKDVINNLTMLDADLRDKLSACVDSLNDGDDMLDPNNSCVTQDEADYIKDTYGISEFILEKNVLDGSTEIPYLEMYVKGEVKTGVSFKYETASKHIFGNVGINILGRLDVYKYVDSTLLLAGAGDTDINNNMQANLTLDYKLGYKNTNYSVFASIEDLKLAEVASEDTGVPAFGTDPLIRIHAQADYRLSIFKLTPFIGTHSRSGYGMGDAYYLGADWGMFVWHDRLGLTFRTMLDKEHLTLGLRAKMWFFQTDLMAKIATKDNIDGIKVNEMYTANIRFFF